MKESDRDSLDVRIKEIALSFGQRDPNTYAWTIENHNLYAMAHALIKAGKADMKDAINTLTFDDLTDTALPLTGWRWATEQAISAWGQAMKHGDRNVLDLAKKVQRQLDMILAAHRVEQKPNTPVEVSHRDRKVIIFSDSVLRVWGPNAATEMSSAPRSSQTVQEAMDWLYKEERHANTPIEELIEEYEADGFKFGNAEGVKRASLRYVETMPDSHVRALLFTLANGKTNQEPNAWRDPTNCDPAQSVTFTKSIAEKWPHVFSMPLYAEPQEAKCNEGSVPAGQCIEELFQRQQAGFERCYEALGIKDDRERSWSALVLAINDVVAFEKSSAATFAKLQRDYHALKDLCSRSETAAAEAQVELARIRKEVSKQSTEKSVEEFKEALHTHFNKFPIPTQIGIVAIMKHIEKVFKERGE
jgi:hypothetical protein